MSDALTKGVSATPLEESNPSIAAPITLDQSFLMARGFSDFPSVLTPYRTRMEMSFLRDLVHLSVGWTREEGQLFADWWRSNIRSKPYGKINITDGIEWSVNTNPNQTEISSFTYRHGSDLYAREHTLDSLPLASLFANHTITTQWVNGWVVSDEAYRVNRPFQVSGLSETDVLMERQDRHWDLAATIVEGLDSGSSVSVGTLAFRKDMDLKRVHRLLEALDEKAYAEISLILIGDRVTWLSTTHAAYEVPANDSRSVFDQQLQASGFPQIDLKNVYIRRGTTNTGFFS
jgi:hypothetical protein